MIKFLFLDYWAAEGDKRRKENGGKERERRKREEWRTEKRKADKSASKILTPSAVRHSLTKKSH